MVLSIRRFAPHPVSPDSEHASYTYRNWCVHTILEMAQKTIQGRRTTGAITAKVTPIKTTSISWAKILCIGIILGGVGGVRRGDERSEMQWKGWDVVVVPQDSLLAAVSSSGV